MDFENNHRAIIARRNQRRALEGRDYKLMVGMFGIAGYSAVANLFVGLTGILRVGQGGIFVFQLAVSLVLGVLYIAAAHQIWFKQYPRWWLVVLPAVISIVLSAVAFRVNYLAIAPFLLNVALIALIPARLKARDALDAAPGD